MSASISAQQSVIPPVPVPPPPPPPAPAPPPPNAVVVPLFTLLVKLNILDPPPPNAVLLVTFLNTLFVVPVPVLLTNDIYCGMFVILLYYRKNKYWLGFSRKVNCMKFHLSSGHILNNKVGARSESV